MWLFPVSTAGSDGHMLLTNAPLSSLWPAFEPFGGPWQQCPNASSKQSQERLHYPMFPVQNKAEMLSQKETPWHSGKIANYKAHWHTRKTHLELSTDKFINWNGSVINKTFELLCADPKRYYIRSPSGCTQTSELQGLKNHNRYWWCYPTKIC